MATEADGLEIPQVASYMQGITAKSAARLTAEAAGFNFKDPYGTSSLADQVMANLKAQGIEADPALVKSLVASAQQAGLVGKGLVTKATDPVISPQPYVAPVDFGGQYPIPLDPTEILTLCEEITVWRTLPEVVNDYSTDQWREMTSLDFSGDGLTYLS